MPFGLWNKKVQVTVDRQKQVDIGYATRQLKQGDLSPIVGIGRDGPVVLNDIPLLEPGLTQRTVESGVKGRIAKSLSFYIPQAQSPEPAEDLVEVDRGILTINADGIAFTSKTRRINVGFGAVESIGHTHDGITIVVKTLQKLHFGAGGAIIPLKVQDRMYRQYLSGTLMRLLVEAVMKISLERRD